MTRKAAIRPATEAVAPFATKITIQEMSFLLFHLQGDGDTSCIRWVAGGCDLVVSSAKERIGQEVLNVKQKREGGLVDILP